MKTIAAWVALAALAAALLFTAGWQVRGWHENRVDLQDLQELFDAQLQQLDELRQVTERARQERRAAEAFRLEQRQRLAAWLALPGDDDCALDPLGLGLWNAANAGPAPTSTEPELLAPCLRPPPATDSSMRALVTNHVESMEILDDCARRQRELAGWARVVSATGIDAWWQQ